MTPKPRRAKKCKVCAAKFVPVRMGQHVCSTACAIKLAAQTPAAAKTARLTRLKARAARLDRVETRQKLKDMQGLPALKKLAQAAFNGYIRARDFNQPCISCSKPPNATPNGWDAGHYRSVGSAPHLRFFEDNCHAQCKLCNRHLAGNHVAYRQGLIARIGIDRVEALEADHTLRHYTRQDLIKLAAHYRAKT